MADKVVVKAEKREGRGKNDSRRLRRDGKIPVSIYGGGGENVAAVAQLSDLAAILRSESGLNTVFSLNVEGEGVSDVIFQDRQIDGVKGRLLHADLRRIGKGEKMEMTVAVHIVGSAPGLTEEGTTLNQPLHEIKVICEPSNVPETIEVDVSNLKTGESIYVSDLNLGKGVVILEPADSVLAAIIAPRGATVETVTEEPEVAEE